MNKGKTGGDGKAYHHGDLRAALIRAALTLIDRHGVKGFSMKDAAEIAGVSTAAPYRHFADKEALLQAIQGEGFALFDHALAMAFESGETASERIENLGVAYVLFALQHPAHFRVMFGLRGGGTPEPEPDTGGGFHLLVQAVGALHPDAPAQVQNDLVLGCWSVVHGFAMLQMEGAFPPLGGASEVEKQLRRTLRLMIGIGDRTALQPGQDDLDRTPGAGGYSG